MDFMSSGGSVRRLLWVVSTVLVLPSVLARTALTDGAGGLRLSSIPGLPSPSSSIVAVIASPGTPSALMPSDVDEVLSLETSGTGAPYLICRGATLGGTPDPERNSLATCSLVAGAIVVDGITVGDVESGLRNSRHARTLTALFRARLKLEDTVIGGVEQEKQRQTIILSLTGGASGDFDEEALENEVKALYMAAAVEKKGTPPFADLYSLKIMSVRSPSDVEKVMTAAAEAAQKFSLRTGDSFSSALQSAHNKVKESGVGAIALDPPHIAHAFVAVGNSHGKQARAARARIAAWRGRVARGLLVDGFGREAESLRKRVLGTFDSETLSASGLPLVASYRREMRTQLQTLVDSAISELFAAQQANLEKSVLKRFKAQLLKTVNDPVESVMDSNAAAIRKESFTFETIMGDLEVPELGLTKQKATRDFAAKLNDALLSFPDSPAAKVKRASKVKKVVSKQKKPGQRAIDLGVDLVAMLRPDGFGTLQGFAGYQIGGNSITFGVHNDADDPQVISQFGGVRPPLLRVQPKLRVDIEL